jgi:hypothetical protein
MLLHSSYYDYKVDSKLFWRWCITLGITMFWTSNSDCKVVSQFCFLWYFAHLWGLKSYCREAKRTIYIALQRVIPSLPFSINLISTDLMFIFRCLNRSKESVRVRRPCVTFHNKLVFSPYPNPRSVGASPWQQLLSICWGPLRRDVRCWRSYPLSTL